MKSIYRFKNLSNYRDCIHLVTKKDISQDFGFSLALHTNENPIAILKNRETIQQYFPNMKFVVANQTHSNNISIIRDTKNRGWDSLDSAIDNCDALITNQKGVMLTILTADCVPILLFDPKQKVVSAIHAGWRGTADKIVYKTIQKMQQEFNSNPKDIIAGIAPSIGRCCYEVDWGVAKHFTDYIGAFDKVGDKYMLDLPLVNKKQLLDIGLLDDNIELSNICTSCEVDNYFSYRKEQGCSGRFMSMIGMS
ncbi:MAG: peptidoglycan editing factor PgeF [Epsilonproteobacteria bacterium]|nr:peptidoglycan editing factor PgeF [Campylobacterota bacterium]